LVIPPVPFGFSAGNKGNTEIHTMSVRLSFIAGLAASLLFGSHAAEAEAGQKYDQLHTLLNSGSPVTAILAPARCHGVQQPGTPSATAAVIGGVEIRAFLEVVGKTIGFSDQHLSVRPGGTAVVELIQYRVLPNDTATITTRALSPTTYQPLSEAKTFDCSVGDGLKFVPSSN
jgi:hypothetical protein